MRVKIFTIAFLGALIWGPVGASDWQSFGSGDEETKSSERQTDSFSSFGDEADSFQNFSPNESQQRRNDAQNTVRQTAGDPASILADVAERYKNAVGVVVIVGADKSGRFVRLPMGTAWAYEPHKFATNSHITEPVKRALAAGWSVFIAINRRPNLRLRVRKAISHPRYSEVSHDFDGNRSVGFTYDVGILTTAEAAPTHFQLASRDDLKALRSGYRIAYLGFPMEGLVNNNLNINSPIATMQSGILTAVSDFWQGDGGFQKNVLLRHNLGATGGASGSPLFNVDGKVIGILNAGNVIQRMVIGANKKLAIQRAPSAAMINFGQRIDLLSGVR